MKLSRLISASALLLALSQSTSAVVVVANQSVQLDLRIFNGAFELELDTVAGEIYQIEFSKDLVKWDNEGYSFRGTGGRVYKVASARGQENAFYRVRTQGDPKNVPLANPSREWIAEAANRSRETVYTNSNPYEINLAIIVLYSSSPDSGASHMTVQVRKNSSAPWLTAGGGRASTRFLQQVDYITAVVPAGWEYQLTNGNSYGFPIGEWNELK